MILAFAAVYIIWGTTYLAIRFAIETLPPFLMGGLRFVIAGALLYLWTTLRGVPHPVLRQWKPALISGVFLITAAQGAVVWAEQYINSGLAAVLVATVPIWMLTFNWARPGGERPNQVMMTGVAAGFAGVMVLLAPWQTGDRDIYLFGAAVVLLGAMSWTGASLYTRSVRISTSHFQTTAMQMLCGGAVLTLVGSVTREWGRVSLEDVSALSALAFFYLVIMGSVVALTAYTWLLGVAQPSRLSTYAYVNPVVAVALGWLLAGETLTPRMALGVAVIVGAVVLVTMGKTSARSAPAGARGASAAGATPSDATGVAVVAAAGAALNPQAPDMPAIAAEAATDDVVLFESLTDPQPVEDH